MIRWRRLFWLGLALAGAGLAGAREVPRHEVLLNAGWQSAEDDGNPHRFDGFEAPAFDARAWRTVEVPHNWDDYGGEHRLLHGNRHGTAWYRREFELSAAEQGRRVFLFFEGVGSYATVWVNGVPAGTHAGGRTTFTLDVTGLVRFGGKNTLAVRADHPAGITDLPWVCGGCSDKPGFSEGSQPMGIFRPVHLVTTNDVRVVPFGVHVWNDAGATSAAATVHVTTELANYGPARRITVETRVCEGGGRRTEDGGQTAEERDGGVASPGVAAGGGVGSLELGVGVAGVADPGPASARPAIPNNATVRQTFELANVSLWSLESPTLYTVVTTVRDGDRVLDRIETPFGIRTIQWPAPGDPPSAPFRLNGKPVFINGTCEYEHLLGDSHAFSDEQIRARVAQIRAAGFNAFRDAHQPHNLRYQEYWDRDGLLWWPQFAAQIWFDTPAFRANFKALLRDWVRERRNSPSLVLWGLANESKLPPDFAAECVALIRELDPTSPSQRLVTTCNSGKGTDWNVPQNWSGTYGGNPAKYAEELRRQRLVGEYGAWRSLGRHSEGGFVANGARSEDRAAALLEEKVRLAESIRDDVPGHFQWLFATHDNPGRAIGSDGQQGADGWAELDRVGPANNKGLLTLWGEPTDLYYLYRANYAPAATDPMVYIVSHTWPDRWSAPGRKSGIVVYSNCDEVELFNDVGTHSLGVRKRGAIGTHFQWDDVEITDNVLYAEGRVGGRVVAHDAIVLAGLPEAPHRRALNGNVENLTAAAKGQNYLYRVNCGGPDYTDQNGQRWVADRDYSPGLSWGSTSWAMEYDNVPPRFGSQRETTAAIVGTLDEPLFQTYRYGREKLRYRFAVPDGNYRVEMYFAEPWYGAGGGDCTGWRLFDVAVNGTTVLRNLDLWASAGFAHALKKVVTAPVRGGWLEVSFPRVASYQAVISAIAVSTADAAIRVPAEGTEDWKSGKSGKWETGEGGPASPKPSAGQEESALRNREPAARIAHPESRIPAGGSAAEAVEYAATRAVRAEGRLTWTITLGLGGNHEFQVTYANGSAAAAKAEISVRGADGGLVGRQGVALPPTTGAGGVSAPANLSMNAGEYAVTVALLAGESVKIEALVVR